MTKLHDLLNQAFDSIIVSFLAAAAAFLLIAEWRATKGAYFVGAWFIGILVGLAAQRLGVPPGWDIIVTAIGVITAPVTVLALRQKTLIETIEDYRRKLRGDKPPKDPPSA